MGEASACPAAQRTTKTTHAYDDNENIEDGDREDDESSGVEGECTRMFFTLLVYRDGDGNLLSFIDVRGQNTLILSFHVTHLASTDR